LIGSTTVKQDVACTTIGVTVVEPIVHPYDRDMGVYNIAARQPNIQQRDVGEPVSIDGSSPDEVQYQINGIPLMNSNTSHIHGLP
jgi:hypothetical protein